VNEAALSRWRAAVLAAAGLCGAAGVALAAAAAHKVQSPALVSASTMLLVHAPAAVAIAAHSRGASRPRWWLAVASVMLSAACLFAGDVTLLSFAGTRLFPMAAPIGGSMMILAWLALAVVAVLDRRQGV